MTKRASHFQGILDKNQAGVTTEHTSQLEARHRTMETELNECTILNAAIWEQTTSTDPEMEDQIMAEEFHMKNLTHQ